MSRRASNEVDTNEVEMLSVPLDSVLVAAEENMRRFASDPGGIEGLARNIAKVGQLQPVVVKRLADEEQANGYLFKLVAGYRRMAALELLKDRPVLVRVIGEREVLANLAENLERSDANLMDYSLAIKTMRRMEMPDKEIAENFPNGKGKHMSASWVSQVGYFMELRPSIQKGIAEGKLPLRVARQLRGLTDEEQDALITESLSAENKGDAAQKAREKKKGKRGKAKKAEESGTRLISSKEAVLGLEGYLGEANAKEKLTKPEEKVVGALEDVNSYLHGRIGIRALANRLEKVLG
jgi:ParB family transcriptional regulator, chromosome partitioning protein